MSLKTGSLPCEDGMLPGGTDGGGGTGSGGSGPQISLSDNYGMRRIDNMKAI